MSAEQHTEWLNLVEVSGPFLSIPVLTTAFKNGLLDLPRGRAAELRVARGEVLADPDLRARWDAWVLRDLLDLGPVLVDEPALPESLAYQDAESGAEIRPDHAVIDPADGSARLLVSAAPSRTDLERATSVDGWRASPVDRMAALLRATDVPLGLVTNGDDWTLVWARPGQTTGTCTWNADYWIEERPTLRAFWSLLSVSRFFAVKADDTTARLLERSSEAQSEVTDQLGRQVRQAVELLVQELARRDSDQHGDLLADVPADELYRASVTVAMRLVFLFVAEERRLLPLDDERYAGVYAASTLRDQLQERVDREGEAPLDQSRSAWHRLLALFRAVHGGLDHHDLRLPAYGGGLFDPDRYPFLEGRENGTSWHQDEARPVPIGDRTVLHVLDALQVLKPSGRGAKKAVPVRLSFRGLDVEQIGHVYEGLLDHTAVRSFDAALGLQGKKSKDGDIEPELALAELEAAAAASHAALRKHLVEHTKLTAAAVEKLLDAEPDPVRLARLRTSCRDEELFRRATPYLGLIRDDLRGYPLVFLPGEVYVTTGIDRRSSGTHYTPRAMAEEVVRHALDPVTFTPGPLDEADPEAWRLNSAAELLDLKVCDIAMGSGAFLVAACRCLAGRVQQAWDRLGEGEWTAFGRPRHEAGGEPLLPRDAREREQLALRLVAERCLYGVDVNPMAVEMAKLSLWLITLSKDQPFSFLDHALCSGDSLLGVVDPLQLQRLSLDPRSDSGQAMRTLWAEVAGPERALADALAARDELEAFAVRDIVDSARKRTLLARAKSLTSDLWLVGDLLAGAALSQQSDASLVLRFADPVTKLLAEGTDETTRSAAREAVARLAERTLELDREAGVPLRRPFHWALAFPEVKLRGGFDAILGNPPFQGGSKISGALGASYRDYLVQHLAAGLKGNADLVAFMVLRATSLTRAGGTVGLVATNTVAQGDTREVGLEQVVDSGWTLFRATSSQAWPGDAALEIAKFWLTNGPWLMPCWLDGEVAAGIGADLWASSRVIGKPERLKSNNGLAFNGSYPFGKGFVLVAEQLDALNLGAEEMSEVVKPYLSGEDLNQRPDGSASRFVIDFGDRTLDEARLYPTCFEHVERTVKPERAKVKRDARRDVWWQFAERAPGLYGAIEGLDRVIAIARVSKTARPVFIPTEQVISEMVVAYASSSAALFGLLSSDFHWWWTVRRGSTMRTDIRYTPSDIFETFAQPQSIDTIEGIGEELWRYRAEMQVDAVEGLTSTYNRFHSPNDKSETVERLRRLHASLDNAVRDAYGWSELDLVHDFHETRFGLRYTFGPSVRQEILDRLLELNLQRFTEEVRGGLHGAVAKRARLDAPHPGPNSLTLGI